MLAVSPSQLASISLLTYVHSKSRRVPQERVAVIRLDMLYVSQVDYLEEIMMPHSH